MNDTTSTPFGGFQEDNLELIRLPEAFFTQLLPRIDDVHQLRLLLYMFWHSEQQESIIRYFRSEDLISDPALIEMIDGEDNLDTALAGLVNQGALLKADLEWMSEVYYFINGPQGRAAVEAINNGEWQQSRQERSPIHMTGDQPNIFKLYEANIGAITPMMAEILKEDEATYPATWIDEAIEIAVTRNVRNWKYIQAILERWQKEGRGDEQNRRGNSQDPGKYRKSWLRRE